MVSELMFLSLYGNYSLKDFHHCMVIMIGFHDGAVTHYPSITANTFEFENDDTYDCDKDVARSTIW